MEDDQVQTDSDPSTEGFSNSGSDMAGELWGEETTDAKSTLWLPKLKSLLRKPGLRQNEANELLQKMYSIAKYRYLARPVIFNHENYSRTYSPGPRPEKRDGTEQDQRALTKLFQDLNCAESEIHKDKTAKDIEETLKRVAELDHSEFASIIVVVLTHGDENVLCAYDTEYETSKLWEPFTQIFTSNQTLVGKPKLFFIQACQGKNLDLSQFTLMDAKAVPQPMVMKALKKIPRCADFLISHSSFLGYMSVRNAKCGSWFIQTLCQAIYKYKSQLDLLSIMTILNYEIAYNREYMEHWKQIPCTETTLTKMLFLDFEIEKGVGSTLSDYKGAIKRKASTESDQPHIDSHMERSLVSITSHSFNANHYTILIVVGLICFTFLVMAWLQKTHDAQYHFNCNRS